MTDLPHKKSRILDAVHKTALDLKNASLIDKTRISEYDALCLQPVPMFNMEKIRNLRDRFQLSQDVLAALLNTSLTTVRQWEIGRRHPGGPSRKLLDLLDKKGLDALL